MMALEQQGGRFQQWAWQNEWAKSSTPEQTGFRLGEGRLQWETSVNSVRTRDCVLTTLTIKTKKSVIWRQRAHLCVRYILDCRLFYIITSLWDRWIGCFGCIPKVLFFLFSSIISLSIFIYYFTLILILLKRVDKTGPTEYTCSIFGLVLRRLTHEYQE